MKRKSFTIIPLIFIINICLSQENVNTYTDVIPPSPTAASLGSYGQVPVGLFTGTAQFNIPLYDLRSRKLSLPISLDYATNGVKVDQIASWVGMGWSLSAGGVITRTVRDRADEKSIRIDFEGIKDQYDLDPVIMEDIILDPVNEEMDTEPDLYSYNFNGQTGKFIIGLNGTPVLIPHQDLQVEVKGEGTVRTFEITTKDGVKYYFGEIEEGELGENSVERTRSQNDCADGRDGSTNDRTAWYLTRIVHPTGDVINLRYASGGATYKSGVNQSYKKEEQLSHSCYGAGSINAISTCTTRLTVDTAILSEISTDNITVSFESTPRTSTGFENKLDAIVIEDKNDPLREHRFDLTYITSSNTANGGPQSSLETKRLFLDQIIETGTDISNPKKHSFDYNNIDGLPKRLSFSQDHWGYYNGANNGDYFVPFEEFYSPFFSGFTFANREPNGQYAQYGTLTGITYPTGGSSKIEYEPNTYYGSEIVFDSGDYINFNENLNGVRSSDANDNKKSVTVNVPYFDDQTFFQVKLSVFNDFQSEAHAAVKIKDAVGYTVHEFSLYSPYGSGATDQQSWVSVARLSPGNYTVEMELDMGGDWRDAENYKLEVTFSYLSEGPSENTIYRNFEAGGVRVKRVTSKESPDSTEPKIERYYYGDLQNPDVSSAIAPIKPTYHDSFTYETDCNYPPPDNEPSPPYLETITVHTLSSNSNNYIYNMGGSHIAYRSVLKSYGENFENGGEYFKFLAKSDSPGIIYQGGEIIPGSAYTNTGWNSGTLKEHYIFKKDALGEFIPLKKELYEYNFENEEDVNNDARNSKVLKAGVIRRKHTPFTFSGGSYINCNSGNVNSRSLIGYECTTDHEHWYALKYFVDGWRCYNPFNGGPNNVPVYYNHPCYGLDPNAGIVHQNWDRIGDFEITLYDILVRWPYLRQKKVQLFDENGLNSVTTVTDYEYENPLHLQLTKETTTKSDGTVSVQKTYYPLDYDYENNTVFDPLLLNAQFGLPIDIRNEVDNKLALGQLLKYNDKGQVTEIHRSEIEKGTVLPWDAADPYSYGEPMLKITYDPTTGNMTGSEKEKGAVTSYLWGYKDQYPIARIENAGQTEVANAVSTALGSLTPAYATTEALLASLDDIQGDTAQQDIWRYFNTALRSGLPDAMVTTYTYDPLVGMTSMTDPKGYTIYYIYDSFNRLKEVRDTDGNLVSDYGYHYANEPTN